MAREIVDFSIENGGFPIRYVKLAEGSWGMILARFNTNHLIYSDFFTIYHGWSLDEDPIIMDDHSPVWEPLFNQPVSWNHRGFSETAPLWAVTTGRLSGSSQES